MNQQKFKKLKREVDELRDLPGKQRAEHIKYYIKYVREKYGEKDLKKVMDALEKLNFNLGDVEKYRDTEWVSETLPHIFFVTAARVLDWSKKEIYDMGRDLVPKSTITKIFLKYFSTLDKTIEKGVKQWNNNFTRGELHVEDLDKEKREGKFVLRGFKSHYLAYVHFQGFFSRILEIMTGSGKVKVDPPKCINKENNDWEWKFYW